MPFDLVNFGNFEKSITYCEMNLMTPTRHEVKKQKLKEKPLGKINTMKIYIL